MLERKFIMMNLKHRSVNYSNKIEFMYHIAINPSEVIWNKKLILWDKIEKLY